MAVGKSVWDAHLFKWSTRNMLNAMIHSPIVDYGPQWGHGLQLRGAHTMPALIPSGDYSETAATFAAHPDWYPLVDGKRVTQYKDGRPVQACTSNPEVIKETARKVIAFLREHPDVYRFSVSHADEPSYWCECPNCIAVDGASSRWRNNQLLDAYGVRSPTGPGPMSRRWATYVNEVAKIVGQSYPDKFLSFYAYGSVVAPPRGEDWRLEPNIIVEYTYGDGWCLQHAPDDANCPANKTFHEWLSGWKSSGNPLIFYDYPPNGERFDISSGYTRRVAEWVRYLHRQGFIGWGGEDQGTWAASGLWTYLKGRLLWDVDADVDALVREFCDAMYGPASEAMQAYYAAFENEIDQVPDHPVWGSWALKLSRGALERLETALAHAEQLASADETAERNVAMTRSRFNGLMMAWMSEKSNAAEAVAMPVKYEAIRQRTLELIKQHNVPTTSSVERRVTAQAYVPPIEAMAGQEVLSLNDGWRFRLDPDDVGLRENWQSKTDWNTEDWKPIRVDQYWTQQGYQYHGVAWYAASFTAPENLLDGRLWLLFGMIDGESEVWINGQSVGQLPGDPYHKPKGFDLTGRLSPMQDVHVVVRVTKDVYAAGINGGVRLKKSQ